MNQSIGMKNKTKRLKATTIAITKFKEQELYWEQRRKIKFLSLVLHKYLFFVKCRWQNPGKELNQGYEWTIEVEI